MTLRSISLLMRMANLKLKKESFLSGIPANWDKIEKAYQAKVKVLTTAQRKLQTRHG